MSTYARGCSYGALSARAYRFAESWPGPRPLSRKPRATGGGRGSRHDHRPAPYWITIPLALAGESRRALPRSFLPDVLWGQFCVFLCVRLQDDAFDDQADRSAIYAGDQFLIEAERAFGRHFARSSRFWPRFHDAVQTTTMAILRVDEQQRTGRGTCAEMARGYAEVAEIFKIGTAGVCLKLRRERDEPALSRFADEIAMAGQIVDDLEDLPEDLGRGRRNYVAQRVLPRRGRGGPAAVPDVMSRLALGDGADRVVEDVRRHLERAARAVDGVRCAPAHAAVRESMTALRRLRMSLHRQAVRAAFAPLRRPAVNPPSARS